VDIAALASASLAASTAQFQLALGGKLLALDINTDRSAVQLIDAAQQNIDRLANVLAGIGGNLDRTV
jgi:hypothetical protein